jgi:hypothetical protein
VRIKRPSITGGAITRFTPAAARPCVPAPGFQGCGAVRKGCAALHYKPRTAADQPPELTVAPGTCTKRLIAHFLKCFENVPALLTFVFVCRHLEHPFLRPLPQKASRSEKHSHQIKDNSEYHFFKGCFLCAVLYIFTGFPSRADLVRASITYVFLRASSISYLRRAFLKTASAKCSNSMRYSFDRLNSIVSCFSFL